MTGTGQTQISPLAIQLMQQPQTHWLQTLGNLAMVGVDQWRRSDATKKQASAIADLLAGPATTGGTLNPAAMGAAEAGGGYSGPKGATATRPNADHSRLVNLLTDSPDLMGAFQQIAVQQQFPEYFGGDLQQVWDPDQNAYVWGRPQPGQIAKPSGSDWQNAGNGMLYRERPDGSLEWQRAPGSGGSGTAKAPTIQTFYDENGNEFKAQWNGAEWVPVGGAKANAPDVPSPSDVVGPILQKIARGEPLSEGERAALDEYQRTDAIDRLVRQQLDDEAVLPYAEPGEDLTQTRTRLSQQAQEAIDQGADPAEVFRMLLEMGVSPGGS